ncbi:MAG: cell division protein FtsL [candidate division FCPU426 bacterium]
MNVRRLTSRLDREFVTIYFLQEQQQRGGLAVRRLTLVLGVIALALGLFFVRAWQQMQVMKLGYLLNQHQQQVQQLAEEHRRLLSQRNALISLQRVEALAREELKLAPPRSEQVVFLVDPAAPRGGMSSWWQRVAAWMKPSGPRP